MNDVTVVFGAIVIMFIATLVAACIFWGAIIFVVLSVFKHFGLLAIALL